MDKIGKANSPQISQLPSKISDTKKLGYLIRSRRKFLRLSQSDLAGACNVGIRFISELENGKATIEFGKVLEVLKGLGLEITISNKTWD